MGVTIGVIIKGFNLDTFIKTLPIKYSTKKTGIYFKEIEKTTIDDKGKTKVSIADKIFYIRYKEHTRDKWIAIGKYSEGIREAYCETKRIEILKQLKLGEVPDIIKRKTKQEVITLQSIFDKYKKAEITNGRIFTSTEKTYNSHIKNLYGEKDIYSITTEIILEFKVYLQDEKKLSNATINSQIGLIKTLFNYAIEENIYTLANPAQTKKLKLLKVNNARERYLSPDEIKKLFQLVEEDKDLNIFVHLSLSTGGRLETILNIKKKDIILHNDNVTLKDFKKNSTYSGFLDDDTKNLLIEILPNLKANDFIVGGTSTKSATRTLQRKLQSLLNANFNVGLDTNDITHRVVIHTLRHTFASHLAINGTPIFTIQRLMNHSDIKMTMRYAKLAPDSGKNEVKGLYK